MQDVEPDKWQRRFLSLTDEISGWSKDPSRGVGAVIVSPSRQIVASGFNGLPRGLEDTPDRLQRPVKYDLTVHAELNAIIQCARNGVSPIGCTIYSSFSPCVQCTTVIASLPSSRTLRISPSMCCTACSAGTEWPCTEILRCFTCAGSSEGE